MTEPDAAAVAADVQPTSSSTSPIGRPSPGPGNLSAEITSRPLGLVVLTGLDVTYNAIHRAIWDSFSANRRPDRVPLNFKSLPADHEYPKCRSKQRTSYEWYIPKGILKTSWMKKHQEDIPGLVVVFYDLDWDEQQWKEKQMECATRVEVVRTSLHGRGSKVAVVLIQKNAPLPPGEDVVAAERAAALCAACELSAKSLFVLPCVDHLLGYTIRLENAFYELTQAYYHGEARRVKAHKEFLNKTTHQLLFVRHAFKIGFFNELKQDTHNALKQYKAAYVHLTEIRAHDTNMLEIKTIAGFLNYKICRLCFFHNSPLDAISQFRKHVDLFKNKIGCAELAFEHSAWMSKQFSIFGDLFDDAIKLGLTAIMTQHPGFYYQQAANHAIARKQLCRGLCHAASSMPSGDPLEGMHYLEFWGQRPWRQGHQSIDPPDPQKEKEGILALQYLESTVDHSWIIIPLLSSAVAQFKKYKSARMKRYLMVQMGEEYYHAKDYSKALTLLGRVTWDYRLERWWQLLTSILVTSLRCAYLVASMEEYVTISLELLGRYSQSPPDEKTRVQMNLVRVLSNNPPEPEHGCAPDAVEKAKVLWKNKTANPSEDESSRVFPIEMRNLVPFVECKAKFTSTRFTADSLVKIEVYLRSSCQFPVRFSRLSVNLSNQEYNSHCVIVDGQPLQLSGDTGHVTPHDPSQSGDLFLKPWEVARYTFQFVPLADDIGKKLEIASVTLAFGDESSRCALLVWAAGGYDAASLTNPLESIPKKRGPAKQGDVDWNAVRVEPHTSIMCRPSRVTIKLDQQPPSLENEIYHVHIEISNEEDVSISETSLTMGLSEGQEVGIEESTEVSQKAELLLDGKQPSRLKGINLGVMEAKSKIEQDLFIRCTKLDARSISVRVSYKVEVNFGSSERSKVTCTCYQDQAFRLETVTPFDVKIRMASLKFESVDQVHPDHPFLLMTDIKCLSPWPITIKDSTLILNDHVRATDENQASQVARVTLKTSENATECICMESQPDTAHGLISLGSYAIEWKRANLKLPAVKTILPLPEVTLQQLPIYISSDLPPFGLVRAPLLAQYQISNKTSIVQSVEACMEPSDAFMYSGHKQIFFRILPSGQQTLSYNLYPLVPGYVKLPKLKLKVPYSPSFREDFVSKILPTHIFIKPQGKDLAVAS
ncbi:trafficking protein particle complex subunit 11-like [Lytechinus pictus]|uniref:trafficking protein particle complex subunit 11-like n=1 Tax=Lytechinus pictus TaxID=7653 RepID=UPI0030B9D0FC